MPQYDVTLRDYWRILRKRKVIVVFATAMLGMTSFAAALVSKPEPRFKATAKVQYEKKQQTAQEAYVEALGESDNLETQQAVISSYPVVERVAHRLGYVDTTTASDEERIRAILQLRPLVQTEVEGFTNIITISITHRDRFRARDIANAVAQEYVNYDFETRNAQIRQSRNFIKAQRDTIAARLRGNQERLKVFQEKTQVISVGAQTSAILSQLDRARDVLDGLLTVRNSIDQILSQFEETGELSESTLSSIPPEEGGPALSRLNAQLQLINQERDRLLIDYTEAHPLVQDLDSRKQVVLQNMLNALRVQRNVLSRRIETQQKTVQDLDREYARLPQLGLELEELKRQVSVQANLLAFYEEQYQQSRIAQAEEVHDVVVLQKALLPQNPINPSTPTTTAGVGALLGLILGVVFAFIAETLDTSIGTIEDVEEYVEVPVVGIIPQTEIDDMRGALVRSGVAEGDTETMERRLRLAAHFEPRSTMAESYRALRTNIQFANLEKGAKVISVTSASNQEGKSTTVANLAITLAQAGNRVLLVDADLRRPTLARIFGLEREPGITDVILGNYSWREVIRTVTDIMVGGLGMEDIMMTPGLDNLNIITSGTIPPNPSEITDTRRMSEFIEEVRDAYDIVLIDSPPVLQATEATILGTKVDGILLVYKIGQVSRSALRRAKLQLDNVNVTVLGVVINGLRAEVSEDFQDLRYYSYYSYGAGMDEETGPPLVRLYNRTLRRLKALRNRAAEGAQPYLAWVREKAAALRPGGADLEDMEIGAPAEEEEDGPSHALLRLLFWLFLLLFLASGILWQLGYVDLRSPRPQTAEPAPADTRFENPPPAPAPEPASAARTDTAAVRPPAPEAPKAPAADRVRPPQYAVHVASHKARSSADREAGAYQKKGYTVRIVQADIPGRGRFYRVLVGEFDTRGRALQAARALKSSGRAGYAGVLRLKASP